MRDHIYLPDPMPAVPLAWQPGEAPTEISVRTIDGLILRGYRWAPRDPARGTILFFHGNGGNRYDAARMAAPLANHGGGVIVASYRGYGDNPGQPTEAGLYHDGEAFYALARSIAPLNKLYLFGYSLGGAVALHLASQHQVDGVITLNAFSSLAAVAPIPARPLLPDRYNNLAAIKQVRAPILLLHGTADEVIPIAEARKLKEAGGDKVRFMRLENAPHRIAFDNLAGLIWRDIGQMPSSPTSNDR